MTTAARRGVSPSMRLLTASLALALATLAYGVEPAAACSCALGDPRTRLQAADAAFVGTFVEKREPPEIRTSADDAVYVFRVERTVKGTLPATVEILSPVSGASCGLEVPVGERVGLLLRREGTGWRASLCDQIDPAQLVAAARPLPPPNGRGALAFLVGGKLGNVRTLGLDSRGRTLAYGRGRGETLLLSTCPGRRRVVEYASEPLARGARLIGVRELRTFRLVRERRHRAGAHGSVASIACLDRAGARIGVFETAEVPEVAARLLVGRRVVWRGRATAVTFAGSSAYLAVGARGTTLVRVHLGSGRSERLARLPANTTSLRAGPRGRVAGVVYSAPVGRDAPPSRVVLYDPASRVTVRTTALGQSSVTGDLGWSRGRLVFLPDWGVDSARVYDSRLRLVARFRGWLAGESVVRDGRAYGLARGTLVTATLPRGPVRVVRRFPTPTTYALELPR